MAHLKDIARASKVSIRTVSRALKGNGYVDTDVRQRVLRVAKSFGYSPNLTARSLRTGKSFDVLAALWHVDELNMAKLAGLEGSLRHHDYQLSCLFTSAFGEDSTKQLLQEILRRRPAGVVIFTDRFSPQRDCYIARSLVQAGISYIMVDSVADDVDSVRIDRSQGVYDAVLHLAAGGRQRIAYWGLTSDSTRWVGYLRAMQQLGRSPICLELEDLGDDNLSWATYGRKITQLSSLPDAIQVFSDSMAFSLLGTLHAAGIQIPQQLAAVGFDDRPMAALAWPPLTTVAQPCRETGAAAADILLQKIAGAEAPPQGWSRTLPTRLVIRESA